MPRRTAALPFLLMLSCGIAAAAPEQWIEVKSDHFTVITDSNEKQGRQVVDQFERMRWMFLTLFPKVNVDPAEPIVVFAARNYKVFQTLEPAAYLSKGQLRLGGLFLKTQDKNYVLLALDAGQDHPFATVYHEYTHLQFASANEWMPLWIDEGLAEFIQNTDIHDKDVHLGQPSVSDLLFLRQNQLIPLATLFRVDHNSPYYHDEQKGSIFYAQSWALTHYLEVNDNLKHLHQVNDYMTLMSHHADPVEAAQKAFGDLKQLQAALSSYVQNGSYREFLLNSAAAPLHEELYKVRPLSEPEADARRADFLACVGRKDDALTMLDAALKADPNNASAFETKGYLAFRDGDQETARQWYAKAVKADSRSYLAQYYYGAMSMSRAGPEESSQIEASLRAAIQLNPAFAPSYDALAVFLARRHTSLGEAYTLIEHAVALDRGNFAYRMNASEVLMTMGRYADAAATLKMATNLAKDSASQSILKSNLEAAQRMQEMGARSTLTTVVQDGRKEGNADTATVRTVHVEQVEDAKPKHPTEPLNGPKHEVIGVLHSIQCSYPSVMDFEVVGAKKTIKLYSNQYYNLDLSALGFTPKGEMNPCKDLEGFKARVQYAESVDKSVDGQVVSVELRK